MDPIIVIVLVLVVPLAVTILGFSVVGIVGCVKDRRHALREVRLVMVYLVHSPRFSEEPEDHKRRRNDHTCYSRFFGRHANETASKQHGSL